MGLPVLAALVVMGVGLIVAAIHFSGGSRPAAIDGADEVRRRFAQDYPNVPVFDVHLTADRRSAFIEAEDGRIGLVHAVGAKFLTRLLSSRDLLSVEREGVSGIKLRFRDFTFPRGHFVFDAAAEADRVAAALGRLNYARRAA